MKIISFLGTGTMRETTYLHPESCDNSPKITSCFFQEALYHFYKPRSIYILLTKQAKNLPPRNRDKSNWEALKDIFKDKEDVNLIPVEGIPETNSPKDIWTIFSKITEIVQPNDEIIFDITNGFRSFPIVALLSISYLRTVSNVLIKGLLYGAFEAKNDNGEAPTFDLLPTVSLLDWITATDRFVNTGNGQQLVDLLTENKDNYDSHLADKIYKISQGLQILRPMNVIEESATLSEAIEAEGNKISKKIPPFKNLLKKVEEEYSSLVNTIGHEKEEKEKLIKQFKMIDWYLNKDKTVHAIALAREWIVSVICYEIGLNYLEETERQEAETLLYGGKTKNGNSSQYKTQWNKLDDTYKVNRGKTLTKQLKIIWNKLPSLRNDVLHTGYRKNPKQADIVKKEFNDIWKNQLKPIATIMGYLPN